MNKKILLAIAITSVSHSVSGSNYNDTISIKEVTITATKSGIELSKLPITSNTIDREAIESSQQVNVIPILAKQIPGLFTTAKGIMGFGISTNSTGMINIRGVGQGNKVLTLIDGQPQWAGIFGHSIADNWVANNVESIEVISGPASLLYGSNAMGGAINIITRQPKENGFDGSAKLSLGSYMTQEYGVTIGYKKDNLKMFVSGNYDRTNGDRNNSQFHLWNGFASAQYALQNWTLGATVDITNFSGHNPGEDTKPIFDNWMDATRGNIAFSLKNRYDKFAGNIQGYYSFGHHKINDGYFAEETPRDYLFKSNDYVAGLSINESFYLWRDNFFTVGYDLQNWGGNAWNDNFDAPKTEIIDRCVTNMGAYIMMQQRFFNMLSINAGTRYEYSEQYGHKWIPQAGIIANLFMGNTVKFSFSEGFRAPNIRELYMYKPANPNLEPEDMYNYEISIKQSFLKDKLNVGLTLFYIDGKEMIQTQIVDGKPINMNIGSFINKGIEAEVSYKVSKMWMLNANYCYLNTNTILQGAPKHKIYGSIHFNYSNVQAMIENQSIFGLYQSLEKNAKKCNYSLLNLIVSYKIVPSYEFSVSPYFSINNMTNTDYSIIKGFPMPGINFMTGVKVDF